MGELRISNAHAMSWAIADGLPPCSRVPPAKCRPPRAQECPQSALRNRGANGKQGRRERVAPWNAPRAAAGWPLIRVDHLRGRGDEVGSPSRFASSNAAAAASGRPPSCEKGPTFQMDRPSVTASVASPFSAANVHFHTSVHGWRMVQHGGNGQCAVVGCCEAYTCCTIGHIPW